MNAYFLRVDSLAVGGGGGPRLCNSSKYAVSICERSIEMFSKVKYLKDEQIELHRKNRFAQTRLTFCHSSRSPRSPLDEPHSP